MATTTFIYNNSDIETVQPASSMDDVVMTMYREKMKSAARVALRSIATLLVMALTWVMTGVWLVAMFMWVDRHPRQSWAIIWAQVVTFILYIFLYY